MRADETLEPMPIVGFVTDLNALTLTTAEFRQLSRVTAWLSANGRHAQ